MRYVGGKHRQSKVIVPIVMEALAEKPDCWYVEPFCGALGVAHKVQHPRMILNDVNLSLMTTWRAVIEGGVELPDEVNREEWQRIKEQRDPDDWMTAYCKFGLSLFAEGGSFKEGYAPVMKRSMIRKRDALLQIEELVLSCRDYVDLDIPPESVVYLDPPYQGKHSFGTQGFDYDLFWRWADQLIEDGHTVFVTEITVPDHWTVLHDWGETNQAGGVHRKQTAPESELLVTRKKGEFTNHQQEKYKDKNMGLFSGIRDAELFERGKFIKPDFYGTLLIKRTIAKETLRSGLAFIVEFEVVETNLPEEHPVGSKVTWFQKMTDKTVAFPSIKAFAAAVAGYELHQQDEIEEEVAPALEELLDNAVANETENDLVGLKVNVQTEHTTTKKGMDFTRHLWQPYSG